MHSHHRSLAGSLSCAVAAFLIPFIASPAVAAPTKLAQGYGTLPLCFEANEGQLDPAVRFVSRGRGYALFLTGTEAVLRLAGRGAASQVVRLSWAGGNRHPLLAGESPVATRSSWFVGSDPTRWRRGVANFSSVRYRDVYPGVDLVYRGTERRLEYDLVVAPHADPRSILLAIGGADRVTIGADGTLVVHTVAGDMQQPLPAVYQETADGQRERVSGRYVLVSAARRGTGRRPAGAPVEVAFALGRYDHSRPLVIDPIVTYSTYLGGSNNDMGQGIAVDNSGSAYITGATTSMTFPGTTSGGDAFGNVFVTKLDPTGTSIVYTAIVGGSSGDTGTAIVVDSAGEAYVTGSTFSSNFPVVGSSYGGAGDAFAFKLDAAGTSLIWVAMLGGSQEDLGFGIAVDSDGNAYIAGSTDSTSFTGVSEASLQPIAGGNGDAFVTKINAAGTAIVYSTFLGGSGQDAARAIAVDASGNAYVTGSTVSDPFPGVNGDSIQPMYGGGSEDAFVTEINPTGTAIVYSTYLGGSGGESAYGIAVDGSGSAYVVGDTNSTTFPGVSSGSIQRFNGGDTDGFVVRIVPQGTGLVYATFLGGSGTDEAFAVALDSVGNAFVAGATGSPTFPGVTGGSIQSFEAGNTDGFVTEINSAGTGIVFSTYLGGNQTDAAYAVAVDTAGSAYVTGITNSTGFPGVSGASLQQQLAGQSDAFVIKISPTTHPGLGAWLVAPCRMVDTRDASRGSLGSPALGPFQVRTFVLTGVCSIPSTAKVLSLNVTIVQPTASGYLALVSGDQIAMPTTSIINFTAGQVRANNAIVALSTDGMTTVKVYNQSPGTVNLLLDVNGFFE